MIFYFSGTGNSLYVADRIAKATGDEARSIPHAIHDAVNSYAAKSIGIVAPIYGHELPSMVATFLCASNFETPYFYFILTYGSRHANCIELACGKAAAAGIDVAYAATLLMVDNWLPNFDMDEQRLMDKDIAGQLQRITEEVSSGKRRIEEVTDSDRDAHRQFLSRGLSFEAPDLQGFLEIIDKCIGCGICARVCPSGCIRIEGRRAVRDALGGAGCTACLACIHACPHLAISLPMGEVNPNARFRNEHVSINRLIAANEQA